MIEKCGFSRPSPLSGGGLKEHMKILNIRYCLILILILNLALFNSSGIYAAGPTSPVGPPGPIGADQSKIGPQGQVGPNQPVGPQGQIGPQQPTGPQGQIGPTSPVGPPGPIGAKPTSSQSSTSQPPANTASTPNDEQNQSTSDQGAATQASSQPINANQISEGIVGSTTNGANQITGESSNNQNTIDQNTNAVIDTTNTTRFDNNLTADVNTGRNTTNMNTSGGDLTSGSIVGAINVINLANSQLVANEGTLTQQKVGDSSQDIILGDPTSSNTVPLSAIILSDLAGRSSDLAKNTDTGANSNNETTIRKVGDTVIRTINDSTINNNLDVEANTGENQANLNTGLGSIVTGTVKLSVNVINFLNTYISAEQLGFAFIDIIGNLSGDIIAPSNFGTGANSNNSNAINTTGSVRLTKESDAQVNNNIDADLETGHNSANGNTLGATISTGQADIDVQSATITGEIPADSLLLVIVNELGEGQWTGQVIGANPSNVLVIVQKATPASEIEATNTNTGANSNNTNTIEELNSTEITQVDRAVVNNHISFDVNTGRNQTNFNTSGGSIKTGDINVATNLVNFVNATGKTFKKVIISVINVFGKWTGNLVFGSKKTEVIPTPIVSENNPPIVTSESVTTKPVSQIQPSNNSQTTQAPLSPVSSSLSSTTNPLTDVGSSPQSLTTASSTDSFSQASRADSSKPVTKTAVKRATSMSIDKTSQVEGSIVQAQQLDPGQPEEARLPVDQTTQGVRYATWLYLMIIIGAGLGGLAVAYTRKQPK
jgi:hypothetical protein